MGCVEGLDVFSDPLLNDLFTDDESLSDINIQNVAEYKKTYDNGVRFKPHESFSINDSITASLQTHPK